MSLQKHRKKIGELFKKFSDDWLPAEFIFPTYAGPRNLAAYEFRNSNAKRAYRARKKEYEQLHYLQRKNWIQVKKTEQGLLVALTDQGRLEKLRRGIERRTPLSDGRVCLVMFDIPEIAKRGRVEFRQFLKRVGFTMVQLSVWETRLDVAEDVLRFIKQTNIQRWTAVYVAEKRK